MDTLHSLVQLRNNLIMRLENLSADQSVINAIKQLELVNSESPEITKFSAHDKLAESVIDYQEILSKLEKIQEHNYNIIKDIDEKIDQTFDKLHLNVINEFSFQVFHIDDSVRQLILDKIQKYADWSYPGLRLGCRYVGQNMENENISQDYNLSVLFSNQLVTFDPLYFCDVNESFITQSTEHFNDIYKNRIRKYVIINQDLSVLPSNQFGFIFSWWVFNFANIITMEDYLIKIYDLLRPGGTFMFSYNNTDIFQSARLVDMGIMNHIPYRNLAKLCNKIGFEIIDSYDIQNSDPNIQIISWVEITKPGKLTTVKRKQVLGIVE